MMQRIESGLTLSPTLEPISSDTLIASDIAATRRGCVIAIWPVSLSRVHICNIYSLNNDRVLMCANIYKYEMQNNM